MRGRIGSLTLTIIFLLGGILFFGVVNFALSRAILTPSFGSMEKAMALRDMERAVGNIDLEIDQIDSVLMGYAEWTDTYDFVSGKGPEGYLEDNYDVDYMKKSRIDEVQIYSPSGKLLFSLSGQPGTERLRAEESVLAGSASKADRKFLYRTGSVVLMVASRPVKDDSGTAPPRGRIVFARVLDAPTAERIASRLHIKMSILGSIGTDGSPPDARGAKKGGMPEKMPPDDVTFTKKAVTVLRWLPDDEGQSALGVMVTFGRVMSEAGGKVLDTFNLLQSLFLVLVFMAFSFMLNRSINAPLRDITRQMTRISDSGTFTFRVHPRGCTEIMVLANSFNRLLDKLSEFNSGLEREIKARTGELSSAIEDLRLMERVFENSLDGILITNREGDILRVNPAFTRITGYTPGEAVGKNPRLLKSNKHGKEFYEEMWKAILEEGQWSGEIWNRAKDGRAYPEWLTIAAVGPVSVSQDAPEDPGVGHFVAVFHDISDIKKQEEIVKHQAFHDALTGLPNRLFLLDQIEKALARAKRHEKKLAILFMDLDHFKAINDTKGHETGDRVLVETANRLRHACRGEETLARQGGDEFVIVMEDIGTEEQVMRFGRRLIEIIGDPYQIDGETYQLGLSVGAALFPVDGSTGESLMRAADQAMYRAKSDGRNNFKMYAPELNAEILARINRENKLKEALASGELIANLDPIVELSTNYVQGFEAVASWNMPKGRQRLSDEHLRMAQEIGISSDIDFNIMDNALSVAADYLRGEDFYIMSFNLSLETLELKDNHERIALIADKYGVSPSRIAFEVNEASIMRDSARVVPSLEKLASLGFNLVLDDFGSGYSAFGQLARLPFKALKISAGFVHNIHYSKNDEDIIMSIIAMARRLSLKIIALGVENPDQLEFLKVNGVDYAQGKMEKREKRNADLHDRDASPLIPLSDDRR